MGATGTSWRVPSSGLAPCVRTWSAPHSNGTNIGLPLAKWQTCLPGQQIISIYGLPLRLTARRLRYTFATKLVASGASPQEVADALDHSSTAHVMVYFNSRSDVVQRLDKAVRLALAPIAQAFMSQVIRSEAEAARHGDRASRIRHASNHQAAHETDLGLCVHPWDALPCSELGGCEGCSELRVVKGDPVARAEALLHSQCRQACASGPAAIEAIAIPGQSATRRAAILQGFVPGSGGILVKVAIGRPMTPKNWASIARFTDRRTGLRLQEAPPATAWEQREIAIFRPDGTKTAIGLAALEDVLGPTLLAWPGRTGTVVPIAQKYADDLLGTSLQASMFEPNVAALGDRRTYVSSPKAANALRPGTPILFYESSRSGGRGAVVAAARVVDAVIARKDSLPGDAMRRSVIEDADPLSSSEEVLVTTFDNVMRCPTPIPLSNLRDAGAAGTQNFISSTPIGSDALIAVLDLGWSHA